MPNVFEMLSERARALLGDRRPLRVLEGGCGADSYFKLGSEVELVGIDISREQLDRNRYLNVKILGDLQTYPLPSHDFDVIICWNVIEHLSRPTAALENMFQATKPGGLVILGFPNLFSFKGLATKFTPFWFHKWSYQFVGFKDDTPFPTYLRCSMLPKRVVDLARRSGFSVELYELGEGNFLKRLFKRQRAFGIFFLAVNTMFRVISLGKSPSLYLDQCQLILKAPGGRSVGVGKTGSFAAVPR